MANDDPVLAERIDGREWLDAALTAVYHYQCETLRLLPWQSPPMHLDDSDDDAGGQKLLRRMLAAGLSRYEPDPLGALR